MTFTVDQKMIEAFASHASDPSFGITIGLRRPDRRQHDLDVFSGEHFVEGSGELRVPISNQEPDSFRHRIHRVR